MRPVAHGATGHMRDGWTVAMTADESEGGRIFFTSTGRSLVDEDEIVVLSVGVDIGSSTSHLVFSRIVLERLDSRYVVTERETFYVRATRPDVFPCCTVASSSRRCR